jgi:hexosaminidase
VLRRLTIGCTVTALSTSMVTAAHAQTVNARPATIPALRVWHGSSGYFGFSHQSRIVVADNLLLGTARLLRGELHALNGRRLDVGGRRTTATRGDIVLKLTRGPQRLGTEGYALRIGQVVTISAPSVTGVFYGTRTLLQLLTDARRVPRGWLRTGRATQIAA